jgi:hypothetical protein
MRLKKIISCVRNVVAIFHHIEKEIIWRNSVGKSEGFEMLKKIKPLGTIFPRFFHPPS